jgi:hypothetical protein
MYEYFRAFYRAATTRAEPVNDAAPGALPQR